MTELTPASTRFSITRCTIRPVSHLPKGSHCAKLLSGWLTIISYVNPKILVTFHGLHDVARFMNEPGTTFAGMQSAFTFLLTARGIPLIYYGDEIGMSGGNDPDNRRDFPGGWPGDHRNAFEVSGRTTDENAMFHHVRKFTRLHAELEPLRRGKMINLAVGEQTWAYARVIGKSSAIVVFNNGTEPARMEFFVAPAGLSDRETLRDRLGLAPDVKVVGGAIKVSLPPRSAGIYTTK